MVEPVEPPFRNPGGDIPFPSQLALSIGLKTPFQRFAGFGSLTAAALWVIQPESLFVDGEPRGWALLADDNVESNAQSTYTPWWAISGAVGGAAALFM